MTHRIKGWMRGGFLILLFAWNFSCVLPDRRTYTTPIASNLITSDAPLPPTLEWNITWGGSNYDDSMGVETESSNIFITGRTNSYGVGYGDLYLAKFDTNGNLLWNETWGGTGYDVSNGISVGASDVYILGFTDSMSATSYDVVLVKYDFSGKQLWNTTWCGINFDLGTGVDVSTDGIYIVAYTNSIGEGGYDTLIAKYDFAGILLWNTTWGFPYADMGKSIAVAADGIFITGYTNSIELWNDKVFLLKYTKTGDLLWNITWGGAGRDYGESVAVDAESVYITGSTNSFSGGDYDIFLVRYDFDGNLIWNVTWGGPNDDSGNYVRVNNDGIYITGSTYVNATTGHDAVLLKYDFDGTLNWTLMWGGNASDAGTGVVITNESIFLTGTTYSFGAGGCDAFLVKYNYSSSGNQSEVTGSPIPWWSWLILSSLLVIIPTVIIVKKRKKTNSKNNPVSPPPPTAP